MFISFVWGVFVRGVFGKGGFCPGGFCPGVYVRGVFVRGFFVLIPFSCMPNKKSIPSASGVSDTSKPMPVKQKTLINEAILIIM